MVSMDTGIRVRSSDVLAAEHSTADITIDATGSRGYTHTTSLSLHICITMTTVT